MRTVRASLLALFTFGWLGCQVLTGIGDLTVAPDAGENGGGSGVSSGSGSGSGSGSASGSASSTGGAGGSGTGSGGSGGGEFVPMGVLPCGLSDCPVGADSACCHDQLHKNKAPYDECISGPPATDTCNTAAGF